MRQGTNTQTPQGGLASPDDVMACKRYLITGIIDPMVPIPLEAFQRIRKSGGLTATDQTQFIRRIKALLPRLRSLKSTTNATHQASWNLKITMLEQALVALQGNTPTTGASYYYDSMPRRSPHADEAYHEPDEADTRRPYYYSSYHDHRDSHPYSYYGDGHTNDYYYSS